MFSVLAWGILTVILLILIWMFVCAVHEDFEEYARIQELALMNIAPGDPKTNPKEWSQSFEQIYGRKPEGNKTANLTKNTLGGFFRGSVLGVMTGGLAGALQSALMYGVAAPTVSSAVESFIDSNPLL